MAETDDVETSASGRHTRSGRQLPPKGRFRRWLRLKQRQAERRWSKPAEHFKHKRLWVKVFLLHVRYTFGYLAAGFLVSAPIQLGTHDEYDRIGKCLVLGLICVLPFVLLWPFTRVDWERMRLPEFKNLELAQTRWAVYVSAFFLLVCLLGRLWPDGSLLWLFDVRVAWLSLVLMAFAWVRVKAHMVLFKEFYTLKDSDDLVLSIKPPIRDQEVTVSLDAEPEHDTQPAIELGAAPEAEAPSDAVTETQAEWKPDPGAEEPPGSEAVVDPNAPSRGEALLAQFEAEDAGPPPAEAVRESS